MWYLCICQQPDNSDLAPTSSGAKGGGGGGCFWIEIQWEVSPGGQ